MPVNKFHKQGKSVFLVPNRGDRESFAAWVARVGILVTPDGTVDKFQGNTAAVVFFSTAASSGARGGFPVLPSTAQSR